MNQNNENRSPKVNLANNQDITLLIIVSVGCFVGAYYLSNPDVYSIAYIMGAALPIALVIWVLVSFIITKNTKFRLASLLCIYAALIAGQYTASIVYKENIIASADHMLKELESIGVATVNNPDDQVSESDTGVTLGNLEPGSKLSRVMKDYTADLMEVNRQYQEELESNELYSIYFVPELVVKSTKEKVMKKIDQAIRLTHKYEDKMINVQEIPRMQARLDKYNMPDGMKKSFLEGFKNTRQEGVESVERIYEIDRQIMTILKGIYIDLYDNKEKWYVEGNQILFTTDQMLNNYMNNANKVDSLIDEQQSIREEAILKTRKRIDSLKNL